MPEYVIVEGRVCVDECELKAVHGFGKFVETLSHGGYVYSMIEDREQVRPLWLSKPLSAIECKSKQPGYGYERDG